jgi:hypothetical protein
MKYLAKSYYFLLFVFLVNTYPSLTVKPEEKNTESTFSPHDQIKDFIYNSSIKNIQSLWIGLAEPQQR